MIEATTSLTLTAWNLWFLVTQHLFHRCSISYSTWSYTIAISGPSGDEANEAHAGVV